MSWGYKILLVYIIFVSGILFLVYRASMQNEDLVTENYYERELKYQERIDTEKRTAALSQRLFFHQQGNAFAIHFPKDFCGKKINGTITLYCPSDEKKDQRQDFTLTGTDEPVTFQGLHKGMNILQISWESGGLSYYFEKKVMIV